tara:strand:- start:825 stop:1736 length:912 start_codon:yes stop_codon:yes gene_type:complete
MALPTTNATTELPAVNQILASVGQAPVTTLDQTNPDVAIAYDTLIQVSQEVQAEGWTFNKEYDYPFTPDNDNHIIYPPNVLQMDLTEDDLRNVTNATKKMDVIRRAGKYTRIPTKLTVLQNGTGSGTNGTVFNVATTTNGSGTGFRANLTIEGNVVTAITVAAGGSSYLIGDNVTIAASDAGTSADVVGSISDATPEKSMVYDRQNHTFEFTNSEYKFNVVWYFDWTDLPIPMKDYITARAAAITSSRIVGDNALYQQLKAKELECRTIALEYECNQGQFTFFGHPKGGNYYNSYKPYHALQR